MSEGGHAYHLIFHCTVANRLWRVVLNLLKMQWVTLDTIKKALKSWTHIRRKKGKEARTLAAMWFIKKREIEWLMKEWRKFY